MKTGTENRRTVGILVVLMLVALFTSTRAILGSRSTGVASPVAVAAKSGARSESRAAKVSRTFWKPRPLVSSLDPTLRFDLLKSSEDREFDAGKVNIFEGKVDIPKSVDDGTKKKEDEEKKGPPPPPPPPPIGLKFFGFASKPGEKKKVFLTSGDDVFIGSEGDIINRRYKIVKITNTGVEIEDILNNNKQTIPLTLG